MSLATMVPRFSDSVVPEMVALEATISSAFIELSRSSDRVVPSVRLPTVSVPIEPKAAVAPGATAPETITEPAVAMELLPPSVAEPPTVTEVDALGLSTRSSLAPVTVVLPV